MLQALNWKQTDKNIFVTAKIKDENIKFKIDDRIIHFLIGNSPKIYFFTININNNKFDFLADFSTLRPIIKSSGKLSFKIRVSEKKEIREETAFGNYVIARGESFHKRFLGADGWQTQEYLFGIIPLEQKNIDTKPQITKQNPTKPTTNTVSKVVEPIKQTPTSSTEKITHKEQKSKFQECSTCGNVITSEFDTCPYCFNSILEPEKDVDFAI